MSQPLKEERAEELVIHILVGDSLTVPISGGSLDAYVAKTTSTVAFVVQNGRTLSSTVLNNLASSLGLDNISYNDNILWQGLPRWKGTGCSGC